MGAIIFLVVLLAVIAILTVPSMLEIIPTPENIVKKEKTEIEKVEKELISKDKDKDPSRPCSERRCRHRAPSP